MASRVSATCAVLSLAACHEDPSYLYPLMTTHAGTDVITCVVGADLFCSGKDPSGLLPTRDLLPDADEAGSTTVLGAIAARPGRIYARRPEAHCEQGSSGPQPSDLMSISLHGEVVWRSEGPFP